MDMCGSKSRLVSSILQTEYLVWAQIILLKVITAAPMYLVSSLIKLLHACRALHQDLSGGYHLETVMDEHLLVIISQERSMIGGDGFKPDSGMVQERDLVLVHTGIRQTEFWYSSEEGLGSVGC